MSAMTSGPPRSAGPPRRSPFAGEAQRLAMSFWGLVRHTRLDVGAIGTVATGTAGVFSFAVRERGGRVRGARTSLGLPACSGGCVSESQTTSGPAILVEGLTKSFGEVRALRGIDLSVPQGTVLGVLGPNGAGKTTAVAAS